MSRLSARTVAIPIILLLAATIGACVNVGGDLEQLEPIQFNSNGSDGLKILILTESNLVERVATRSKHMRVERFPPRFVFFVSAPAQHRGEQILIRELVLNGPDDWSYPLIDKPLSLRLRTAIEEERGLYEEYTHLKYQGGSAIVRSIFFSERVEGVRTGEAYSLTVTYDNLAGEAESFTVEYDARHRKGSRLFSSDAYWGSV